MTDEIAPAGSSKPGVNRHGSGETFTEQTESWGEFGFRTAAMLVMTSPLVFAFGALFTSPMGSVGAG